MKIQTVDSSITLVTFYPGGPIYRLYMIYAQGNTSFESQEPYGMKPYQKF